MEDMTLKETLRLLQGIFKAKAQELHAMEQAWPNPTPNQSKRIEKIRKEMLKANKHIRRLEAIINNYEN